MISFLLFLGIVLQIIKANGWIVVPTFCIVFCYVVSFASWMMYSYARGIASELVEKAKMDKSRYVK